MMDRSTTGSVAEDFRVLSHRLSRTQDVPSALNDLVDLATATTPRSY